MQDWLPEVQEEDDPAVDPEYIAEEFPALHKFTAPAKISPLESEQDLLHFTQGSSGETAFDKAHSVAACLHDETASDFEDEEELPESMTTLTLAIAMTAAIIIKYSKPD